MEKQYKITDNGFIWIYENGIRVETFFYHRGCESIWERCGYTKLKQAEGKTRHKGGREMRREEEWARYILKKDHDID